jgi:vacuolar-type H+-ATPase subunit E/Vma4
MIAWGSIESVIAAIREEARAESDRIDADAAAAIARLRDEDARVPSVIANDDARVAAARRRARERAAEEDWNDRSAALDRREEWMARALSLAIDRLRAVDPATRREDLRRLACEAAARVGGPAIDVRVAPGDVALADDAWVAEVAAAAGARVTVSGEPAITGGCVAVGRDGRVSFDNTFAARARRLEPVWRQALNQLFEAGAALATTPASWSVAP